MIETKHTTEKHINAFNKVNKTFASIATVTQLVIEELSKHEKS